VFSLTLKGAAERLLEDRVTARASLEAAIRRGGDLLPAMVAPALAQLALLAADEGDWIEAQRHIERGIRMIDLHGFRDRPPQAPLLAAAALVHAHNGDLGESAREAKQAGSVLASLVGVAPWAAIDSQICLARTAVIVGDPGAAREAVRVAQRLLTRYPDIDPLVARFDAVRELTNTAAAPLGPGVPALTPAELRVLLLLPTHLTFGEIADQLFVSRNTVKTQAIAVYRKFGVSSRAAAVDHAMAVGIL
jgi:LuxR family maltose regulon positive regulatory protein